MKGNIVNIGMYLGLGFVLLCGAAMRIHEQAKRIEFLEAQTECRFDSDYSTVWVKFPTSTVVQDGHGYEYVTHASEMTPSMLNTFGLSVSGKVVQMKVTRRD